VVYVDDVPTGVAEQSFYLTFIKAVEAKFKIKEKTLDFCLGIEVTQTPDKVELKQTSYIQSILQKHGLESCNPALSPLDPGFVFSTKDSPQTEADKLANQEVSHAYKSLVGDLMYLVTCTRPDPAVAVSKLSHVMSNPTALHLQQAKQVLRYIKGTSDLGITYHKHPKPNILQGYCDADHGGCPDTRKSTTGWVFLLNGGPISWSSKLQASVAVSTTEAEYVALSTAGCETQYLRALLSELGSPQTAATIIHEDNFGCVQLTKEQVNHSRTKHIDIRFHKIRELVTNEVSV
jgi:hypothetical protein